MIRNHIDPQSIKQSRLRDRVVDWLGAQGPSVLTIYMCSAVGILAFVADALR